MSHNFELLNDWIRSNKPELWNKLENISVAESLGILNKLTGLEISEDTTIEEGSRKFLAAFKKKASYKKNLLLYSQELRKSVQSIHILCISFDDERSKKINTICETALALEVAEGDS